jgi:hypothetical protein
MSKGKIERFCKLWRAGEPPDGLDGDVRDLPLNSPQRLDRGSRQAEEQAAVLYALGRDIVTKPGDMGDVPNPHGIRALRKAGFEVTFDLSQYDSYHHVGTIERDDQKLDISDPEPNESD